LAERPSPSEPPSDASSSQSADSAPPSLGAQFGRTRSAFTGLVSAHLKLLSAELSEIMDVVKRAAALGGIAVALVFLAGMLVFVGTILWLDEWIFGSIGWGALHGGTLLLAVAVTLGLLIIPNAAPRIGLGFFVAAVVAIAFGLILWLQLTSRAWGWIGDGNLFGLFKDMTWFDGHLVSAADKPIVAGVVSLAVLFGVVAGIVGLAVGSGLSRVGLGVGFAVAGAVVGGLLGALLGVPISWGISIAVALVLFLILYPILAAFFVIRKTDFEALKNSLLPNQTIETTKETIEWVREQMPHGRKS
jgi:uncharacterized membrane protein YqjE